jgi:hypothetical protein
MRRRRRIWIRGIAWASPTFYRWVSLRHPAPIAILVPLLIGTIRVGDGGLHHDKVSHNALDLRAGVRGTGTSALETATC